MNKLVRNYPTRPTNVVDGRTFDAIVELGWNTFRDIRLQMQGIELPDRLTVPPEQREQLPETLEKAKQCLRMALGFTNGRETGYHIVVSPSFQPNRRYKNPFVRVFVQANRENILYPPLCGRWAGLRFLDVCNLIQLAGELKYDLDEVKKIVDSFELCSLTWVS